MSGPPGAGTMSLSRPNLFLVRAAPCAMHFLAAEAAPTNGNHRGRAVLQGPLQREVPRLWTQWGSGKGPAFRGEGWSGRRDSNPRPLPWQGSALPLSYSRVGGKLYKPPEPCASPRPPDPKSRPAVSETEEMLPTSPTKRTPEGLHCPVSEHWHCRGQGIP